MNKKDAEVAILIIVMKQKRIVIELKSKNYSSIKYLVALLAKILTNQKLAFLICFVKIRRLF